MKKLALYRIVAVALAVIVGLAAPASFAADATRPNVYLDFPPNGQPALKIQAAAGPGVVSDNGSVVFNTRVRTTIANVNAGATLLPAIAGYKYRLINAAVISVGGAVGTCTAVTIGATQSTSSVALLSIAIAAMTRSTVLLPNSSNVTVLADGASFVQNDANTAITIGKTGGTCDTATNVDAILTYAIES